MIDNQLGTDYFLLILLFSSYFDAKLNLCRNDNYLLDCEFILKKKFNFELIVTLLINIVINILCMFYK